MFRVLSTKNIKKMAIASCTVLQVVCHIILLWCPGQFSSADGNGSITNKLILEALRLVL